MRSAALGEALRGRTVPDETRAKISASLGRRLTRRHRRAVAEGMRRYWALRERSGTS